jgi:hypothetical protein
MELDLGSLFLSAQPIYPGATDNDPVADNRQNLAACAYCLLDIPNLETPNLMFAKEALKENEEDDHNKDDGINLSTLSRFQLLPGEIRQQIYDYVFSESYDAPIERDKSTKQNKYATKYKLTQRYHMLSVQRLPVGLVFSCKSIYNETILYLYEHTCFTFDTTKALRRFLRKASPEAKAVIQHVQLKHTIHNRTHDKRNEKWELISNAAWKSACQRMAQDLTSLRFLSIEVTVYPATALTMDEPWCEPYLSFCGPDGKGRLEWVHIVVSMNTPAHRLGTYRDTHSARLNAGLELERRLMTDDAFEKKELADSSEQHRDRMLRCRPQ